MRKNSFVFLLFTCVFLNACVTTSISKNNDFDLKRKQRVAVIEAPYTGNIDLWTIIIAGASANKNARPTLEYLENELMKTGKFEIIERQQLNLILNEQKLSLSGLVDKGDFVKIGKLASLDGLVVLKQGTASVFWVFPLEFFEASISAKYVNIETGQLLWSGESAFSCSTVIPFIPFWINYEKNMTKSLVEKLLLEYSM